MNLQSTSSSGYSLVTLVGRVLIERTITIFSFHHGFLTLASATFRRKMCFQRSLGDIAMFVSDSPACLLFLAESFHSRL